MSSTILLRDYDETMKMTTIYLYLFHLTPGDNKAAAAAAPQSWLGYLIDKSIKTGSEEANLEYCKRINIIDNEISVC